jgi:hypothetical protein
VQCPNCQLLNPPEALRCDCGYNFANRTIEQSYAVERQRVTRFFIQWVVFSVIGTLAFLALLRIAAQWRPPLAVAVALMPAYFFLGMFFMDIGGPTTAAKIVGAVAFSLDALYYGLVLLIVWRVLMSILRRTTSTTRPIR